MTLLQMPVSKKTRPSHLVRLAVPRLNKQDRISSYLQQLESGDYDLEDAEITESRQLSAREWNELMMNLLEDRDWLAEKGGTGSWTMPGDCDFFKLSEADREEWKRGAYILVIEVIAPTGQRIYIDPQGYNYARYVGFLSDRAIPEPKTRQQISIERAKAEAAIKLEALKASIANPPAVPSNHGLRFLWNGIKVGNGQLLTCWYSTGPFTNYPDGTLTVSARDYNSFPAEVRACFNIENNTDVQSDYFDSDRIRVTPNHPLYSLVKAAHEAAELHYAKVSAKRKERKGY